ncbi:MAG TPA: hypothetical protein HPQ04_13150, partial [Rhodospirillaceae bacterium]|nr:hypothetical protein [Rhodospirillaceae bacterium]
MHPREAHRLHRRRRLTAVRAGVGVGVVAEVVVPTAAAVVQTAAAVVQTAAAVVQTA